jgi:hypothetical protein
MLKRAVCKMEGRFCNLEGKRLESSLPDMQYKRECRRIANSGQYDKMYTLKGQ